jgi:entericidin B
MANWKSIALALAALAGVLAGCNTMHGLGQDIERGGEKIQSAADKAKK